MRKGPFDVCRFADLKVIVENRKGTSKTFRRASSGDPRWRDYPLTGVTYPTDYGYIEGFTGEDGEGLDIFVGSGELFGCFHMWKVNVPSETKFFASVTQTELEQILAAFKPLLVGDAEMFSETRFMDEIGQFRNSK